MEIELLIAIPITYEVFVCNLPVGDSYSIVCEAGEYDYCSYSWCLMFTQWYVVCVSLLETNSFWAEKGKPLR